MKKAHKSIIASAIGGLLLAGGTMSALAGGNATNQTAQGIMVNLIPSGEYAINETDIYRFDQITATTYFNNAWDGVTPAPTCTGGACAGNVCGVPAAPEAPAPDPNKVYNPGGSGVADKSRCTFLDGGALSLTDSYTQKVSVDVSCDVPDKNGRLQNKKGTYTYTYNYSISPIENSATVAPYTAWDLEQQNTSGNAVVGLNADIAGESVLVKSATTTPNKKYSFSMYDSYGVNRVQNLAVMLDGVVIANPGSTISYPVDFAYTTNAGSNGVVTWLANGDARTILNTDDFAGNNNGGADGSALALAKMDPVQLSLDAGDHSVTLTGVVKDNSAIGNLPINVTQTITVVTSGCGGGH